MGKEMQYYLADINDLIPYIRNARTHSESQIAQIAASIKEFGFLSPILIAEDNTILAGHGRLAAARKLGLKQVPCVKESHLTETQRRAYIIADNKLSLNAGWDDEMLAIELSELQGADFDLELLGFDESELASIFEDDKEVEDDDFDVEEELNKPCFSKAGDIWTLGRHRLICGDATKEETYKRLMDGKKANLVVTDPPYNVNYEGSAGKIKNDNMNTEKFYNFLLDAFSNMEKVMADDASKKNADHPTMKPIALLAYPITNSSMSNTLILDPFGGSGSTLIACEQTDRSCYTIELDEKFCDVIVKRYIEQVGTYKDVSVLRDGKEYLYSEVTADE